MKQILQNVRSGKLELLELPAPAPARGQVLVRTAYSVMSPGTEKLAMDFARKSLLAKARSRPDLVKQVLDKLQKEGPLPTYRTVTSRLDGPQPLGYSSSGIVDAVGEGVTRFAPGDHVACAGAGYANHAELVVVPENLVAALPEGVSLEHAAFATVGAIALQGVRVAEPTLGEVAAVIGLGLIGQLTVQLLRANGCRVLGVDLDPKRVEQARALGAEWGAAPSEDFGPWLDAATDGHGADFVVVTASSSDARPLALAAQLARMKGRLSLVGAFPIEAERRPLYDKELELRMSMSYGPGRYDRHYEEEGLDYPLPFVRWTENRNLDAFLQLVRSGALDPDRLDTETVPFEDAVSTYEALAEGRHGSLAALFRYAEAPERARSLELRASEPRTDGLGLAFFGAGNYAKGVLLPAVRGVSEVDPRWLVTATGASARASAEKYGFPSCATDPAEALGDPAVDWVFITTRHDSHAELAASALRAGKAVWLEKPVALDAEQLATVEAAVQETGGFLAVGYNRRFSKHAATVREAFAQRQGPLAMHYCVAAGPAPAGTWIVDPTEGGGRVVGEACHFVDLCSHFVGMPPSRVFAQNVSGGAETDDSSVALLGFPDGSTATIEYLSRASGALPKERFEVSGDGLTASCENFRTTTILGRGKPRVVRTVNQDKGQASAVAAVAAALRAGAPSPFSLEEILGVSRATFAWRESLRSGLPSAS